MNLLLLSGNYLATALVVILCLRKGPVKLLDPSWAFVGGYFINYCVRPTLFLINPELGSAYSGMFNQEFIYHGFPRAMIFALVGLFGFAIGNLAFSGASGKLARLLPAPDWRQQIPVRPFYWIAFLFLLAGCAGLYGFITEVGWAGTLLELLEGGQRDAFMLVIMGHGHYTFAMQLSLIGWAMICTYWFVAPSPPRHKALRRVIQVGWFLLTLSIWAAFGERSSILAVLFIPLAIAQAVDTNPAKNDFERPRKPSRLKAIVLTAVFFAVAGPVGLLIKSAEMSPAAAVAMSISAWDSFEFTVITENQVRTRNLFWGKTYWQDLVYTWFPRWLFPWKPVRYGTVLVQDLVAPDLMDNEGATFPPGILVEAFCNFGYPGLFLVPLLIGVFCRSLYVHLQRWNWFWLILMAVSFGTLASFRGFGGFVALLLAYGVVLWLAIEAGKAMEALHSSLGRLHVEPLS